MHDKLSTWGMGIKMKKMTREVKKILAIEGNSCIIRPRSLNVIPL